MFTIYELKKTDVQAWCHWKTCISKRTALVSSIFGNEYSGIYTLQFDMILWEHIMWLDSKMIHCKSVITCDSNLNMTLFMECPTFLDIHQTQNFSG